MITTALWSWLRQPGLLLILAGLLLVLAVAAFWLPQLPSELADDPAAATRWLIRAGAEFGPGGEGFQALGLFDVLHSPLLRVLLIILGVVLAVHVADKVGVALALRQIRPALHAPTSNMGQSLPLRLPLTLYRARLTQPQPTSEALARVDAYLHQHYEQIEHTRARIDANSPEADDPAGHEERLLGLRQLWSAPLQPLLPAGLLLLVLFIWLVAARGWSITLPPLGPGEGERYAPQQLDVRYALPTLSSAEEGDDSGDQDILSSAPVALEVTAGAESAIIPVEGRTSARVGAIHTRVEPGPPGLLVQTTDGEPGLTMPGRGTRSPHVGLVFPDVGTEFFVLLPDHAVALRILRGLDQTGAFFLVETFEGLEALDAEDVQPSMRLELRTDAPRELTLLDGAAHVQLAPYPSLQARVRYLPGAWLLAPALLLVLLGAISYYWRASFLLLQVTPEGSEQTLLVAQTNLEHDKVALVDWLTQGSS